MEGILYRLSERLANKGFMTIEVRLIINDVINIILKEREYAIVAMNRECEQLGWGVDIIDFETYDLIMSLSEYQMEDDARRYI